MSKNDTLGGLARRIEGLQRVPAGALPARSQVRHFLHSTLSLMFPQFAEESAATRPSLELSLAGLELQLNTALYPLRDRLPAGLEKVSADFLESLPGIFELMLTDAKAIFEGDPAAKSIDEVIVAYPGFYAIAVFRLAHRFWELGVPVFPRLLTEMAHQFTGIDIHPGAHIGPSFCIDHGTGVVIGETSNIGKNVKLYQGVTLGALSVQKSMASHKRHPTIEDNCVVYSHATILGGETVIGHDSVIGGNVWLTNSVAPDSTVYHKGELILKGKQ